MLDSKPLDKLIFLDIETTSQYPSFSVMPELLQKLFMKHFRKEIGELAVVNMEEYYSSKAPLRAEWGKILCISIGTLTLPKEPEGDYSMKITSFSSDNEIELLEIFIKRTASVTGKLIPEYAIVAHAANLFDIPFISKRIVLNRLALPKMFDNAHLKPWDKTSFIDTLEIWKFGAFDGAAGLDLLAYHFGVESSKTDMDGGDVKKVYWEEKDLPRIVRYCEADVRVLAEVYLKMKNINNKVQLITK